MTTVGFIGSGNIGTTVARLAVTAGYDVVMSNSRGPDSLRGVVGELGPSATAVTAQDVGETSDLVVVTIPLKNYPAIPALPLRGKTVIDTMNYYPERDGRIAALDEGMTSTSELVQSHLAGSHVVKGFSNIYAGHLRALPRPHGVADRSALPIAGDHVESKSLVSGFLDDVGFDAVDVGPLRDGWRFERGTPAYCVQYAADPVAFANSRPGERPEAARPAGTDEVRTLLGQATYANSQDKA